LSSSNGTIQADNGRHGNPSKKKVLAKTSILNRKALERKLRELIALQQTMQPESEDYSKVQETISLITNKLEKLTPKAIPTNRLGKYSLARSRKSFKALVNIVTEQSKRQKKSKKAKDHMIQTATDIYTKVVTFFSNSKDLDNEDWNNIHIMRDRPLIKLIRKIYGFSMRKLKSLKKQSTKFHIYVYELMNYFMTVERVLKRKYEIVNIYNYHSVSIL